MSRRRLKPVVIEMVEPSVVTSVAEDAEMFVLTLVKIMLRAELTFDAMKNDGGASHASMELSDIDDIDERLAEVGTVESATELLVAGLPSKDEDSDPVKRGAVKDEDSGPVKREAVEDVLAKTAVVEAGEVSTEV